LFFSPYWFFPARRQMTIFFWLSPKETKTQGLEVLSDKFVKTFKAATQAAMKNRRVCVALCCGR